MVNIRRALQRPAAAAGLSRLDGHAWRRLHTVQHLKQPPAHKLQVRPVVQVLHVTGRDVQVVVGPVVLEVVVVGQLVGHLHAAQQRRLVRPAARHVAHGVPAPANDQRGHAERLDVCNAVAVALERQVEAAQPVAAEAVGAALQHHRARLELLHDLADHGPEHGAVGLVVHAVPKREVDGVVLAAAVANVAAGAGAGGVGG